MELKQLDKAVLKLWYVRASIVSLALLWIPASAAIILWASGASGKVTLSVLLGLGITAVLLVALTLVFPALRYRAYAWGYDEKRIVVKKGVVFKRKTVIPVCQIQDLHRTQGPLMMLFRVSGVTISTAGSNFELSTLATQEADRMIDELEKNLEARIEEMKNEAL